MCVRVSEVCVRCFSAGFKAEEVPLTLTLTQQQKGWKLQPLLQRFLVERRATTGTKLHTGASSNTDVLWTRFAKAPPTITARHGTLAPPQASSSAPTRKADDSLALWPFFCDDQP